MNWKQFDQNRWQFLKYGRREFRRALSKQVRQATQSLKDRGTDETLSSLNFIVDEEPMYNAYKRVYLRVGGYFGRETFRQYAKSDTDPWVHAVLGWLEDKGAEKVSAVTETTRTAIRREIVKGVGDGLGIDDIANNMRKAVGGLKRAELIARTEIISASNLGSLEGARSTGLPMRKIWLSTPDGRTRLGHLAANGQKVESLDSVFMVTNPEGISQSLKYPGDIASGASPSNTINCRCAIGYDPY